MNCPIPKKCFAGCGASLLYLVLFQLTSSNEACVSFSSLAGSAGRGAVWALALPLADRLWLLSTRSLDHRATKVRTRGYGGLQGSVSLLGKLCSLNLQSVGSQMLGLMLLVCESFCLWASSTEPPCTAMPSPTVQTAPPMSVLGPLHGPGSSVQCTLFAPLCVSDTWDAFADFKDCFVARLFN